MIKLHTQQGDLTLIIVNEIPKTAKRINLKEKLIVLKGEGTNTHTITDTDNIEAYEEGGVLYLKTKKEVTLIHEEHGTTTLEPNKIYRRGIEREFDYESNEARNTKD